MKFSIATVAAVAGLVSAEGWDQWSSSTSAKPVDATTTPVWSGEPWKPSTPADTSKTTTDAEHTWTAWTSSSTPVENTKTSTEPEYTWSAWESTSTPTKPTKKTTTSDAAYTWSAWESSSTPVKATQTTEWASWAPTDAGKPDSWTTTVVKTITTYIPVATTIVHNGKTYPASAGQTLTVTDCGDKGCVISIPVFTKTSTSCSTKATPEASTTGAWSSWSAPASPAAVSSSPASPAAVSSPAAAWSSWASTPVATLTKSPVASVASAAGTGTSWGAWQSPDATSKGPAVAQYTGAATRNAAAGLAGVAGLAALLL